ncbi:MAG: exodeoxyribonuclease VII small subunit [Eubacterium sp.]|nr:exodeoxyribonuclease VII small subunit [Eubacterium sp.]
MAEKNRTIEENFEEINQIISEMQSEDITLGQSFEYYKKGLELVRDCNDQIEKIEKEMTIIEEGNANE